MTTQVPAQKNSGPCVPRKVYSLEWEAIESSCALATDAERQMERKIETRMVDLVQLLGSFHVGWRCALLVPSTNESVPLGFKVILHIAGKYEQAVITKQQGLAKT